MSSVLTSELESRSRLWRRDRSGPCTAATVDTRQGRPPERVGPRPSDAQAGGRLTLEQRLDSVWEGLRAGGAPDCPVCRAELVTPADGRGVRCGDCGSTLS